MDETLQPDLPHVPLQVMVVDDEAVIVDELMEFFGEEGIGAISAPDAGSSLRALREAPPGAITVILTDVKMPGQDGLSFAQSILSVIPERDAVEVIIMTGHGSFGMAIEALRSRVFDFLRKPVKLSELGISVARAHAAAVARRTRAREDEENVARLREMTLALSARAEALTQRMRDAPASANADVLQVISREMRNPLVPVVGLAELIEENALALRPAQIVEYAGLIRQSGWQLTNLIEAIEFASGTSDTKAAAPRLPAGEIVAALLQGHGVEARRAGLSLEAAPAPDITLAVNRVCLMLALDQLISDAIRRGSQGDTIRLETVAEADALTFRIIDHGHDISSPASGPGGDVHGLTLRLADRMAQVLGGRLAVRGTPGGPNVASLVLPTRSGQSPA